MRVVDYRDIALEHDLQAVILRYLERNGRPDCYWFAIPNAAKRSLRLGARMKREGMKAGVADLCIMLPDGVAAWMESKRAKGTQTDAQKGFQAICGRLGHRYAVVRSLDEAIKVLVEWRVLR